MSALATLGTWSLVSSLAFAAMISSNVGGVSGTGGSSEAGSASLRASHVKPSRLVSARGVDSPIPLGVKGLLYKVLACSWSEE
jgi:hypothetical protein